MSKAHKILTLLILLVMLSTYKLVRANPVKRELRDLAPPIAIGTVLGIYGWLITTEPARRQERKE